MASVTTYPEELSFETGPEESLLAAALRARAPFAHACGGRAKCSTCRVWVQQGLEHCPPRAGAEARIAERLGLDAHVRLACQLRPTGPVAVRRLVLDETDLLLCSQLDREAAGRSGEILPVTIFFSDIQQFTRLSASLPAYDVMYLLNRYFVQAGDIVERNGGYIDKFIGDGLMAIFGTDARPEAPLRAVNAALQTLEAVDRLKPSFRSMYGVEFDVRIGLHHGEAVIGTVGSIGHERLTAIGDVVNVASRVETANKEAGTRLLVSDPLYRLVEGEVTVADFLRTRLPGTAERMTLHEVSGLSEAGKAALALPESRDTVFYAGRTWTRLFPADELAEGEHRILPFEDRDVVVLRKDGGYFAFNNACPHLNIPLFDHREHVDREALGELPDGQPRPVHSMVTDDLGLVCRWHLSCFDLMTGEIRDWAPLLEDGLAPGFEFIGEISKNPARLQVFPCQLRDGQVWAALGERG